MGECESFECNIINPKSLQTAYLDDLNNDCKCHTDGYIYVNYGSIGCITFKTYKKYSGCKSG